MPRNRLRAVATGALIALLGAAALMATVGDDRPDRRADQTPAPATSSAPAPTLPPPPPPLLGRGRPVPDNPHVLSWTLLDVADGSVLGQHWCLGCTNHIASVVKVWLAGDALHHAGPHPDSNTFHDVDAAIIDSDNAAATRLFRAAGRDRGLWRMTTTCHMNRTLPSTSWGATELTSSDLAMLGVCAANGDIAGDIWTGHLLDRMRAVRGAGRFGPVDALPAGTDVAMKNGWLIVAGQWHVNCLAIIDGAWSLGIITRYPAGLGLAHGARLCADVTRALATTHPTTDPTNQEKM